MVQSCKGICVSFKGIPMINSKRYESGQKRCSYCELFLKTPEIRCPCCKTILRTKSRSRYKKKIRFDNLSSK